MGANSKIEWTDHTFNPWIGCTKVSPACDNCYAERLGHRFGVAWGKGHPRKLTSASYWKQPLAWNRRAEKEGRRYRVFCASLADVFDVEVPDEWRDRLFDLIEATPHLDWLLLTKRPKVMRDYITKRYGQNPPPHIWLGTTIENQPMADLRIPELLATPCAGKRFVSFEPALGGIDIRPWLPRLEAPIAGYDLGIVNGPGPFIDWVIAGGESGPKARPSHPDWFRAVRDQCQAAGVPFFFKQWGEWAPQVGAIDGWMSDLDDNPEISRFDHLEWDPDAQSWGEVFRPSWCDWDSLDEQHVVSRIGKRHAGRMLDGREWMEVPR